jgi:DNA-binding MarR family transcriptional regulator
MLCDITIKGEKKLAAKPLPEALPNSESSGMLGGLVGYRLRRASGRMMADFASSMAPAALRPVLFGMLCVIRANPGIIQMGLGAELGIQRANLVPLVNELTGRDLIERRPAPNDRRAFALYLTPEGERLLDQAETMVLQHEERMLSALSRAERAKLLELLAKIAAE